MDENTTLVPTEVNVDISTKENEKFVKARSPATQEESDHTEGKESSTEENKGNCIDESVLASTPSSPDASTDQSANESTEINCTVSKPTFDVNFKTSNANVTLEQNVNSQEKLNTEVDSPEIKPTLDMEENVNIEEESSSAGKNVNEKNETHKSNDGNVSRINKQDCKNNSEKNPVDDKTIEKSKEKSFNDKNTPYQSNDENISHVKEDSKDNNEKSPVDDKIIKKSEEKSFNDVEQESTKNEESKQTVCTSDIKLVQDETVDSSKDIEDFTKEVSKNENCESEILEQQVDKRQQVNEDKSSEVKELAETCTKIEDEEDQLDSIEKVQKYLDDTSNQEAPIQTESIRTEQGIVSKESEADQPMDTDSLEVTSETLKPLESGVDKLNEEIKVSPSKSIRENKIQIEDIETKEEECNKVKGPEEKVSSIDNFGKSPVLSPITDNLDINESLDVDSKNIQSSTHVTHTSHESAQKHESPKRKVPSRSRKDPVAVAPLSFSKLYYLDSDKNFTGFFSEYYDSTIYMYRGYWNYVKGEHNIPIRPLPEYKSTLYKNYKPPVVQLQPTVQTSSGRVVKKKEFTPSVPSSQQVTKKDHLPSSTKKETPQAKKESPLPKKETPLSKKETPETKKESKKEAKEDPWHKRYLIPLEKYGWKREVVFRTNNSTPSYNTADIYYYSPKGKKLRSIREIIDTLDESGELKPYHFTFVREVLGFGSPLEVSREAVSRTLTNCDEDTPKRSKTTPVNRKVFFDKGSSILSPSVKSKSETSRVQNISHKVNKHLQSSSSAVKRSRDHRENEDSPPIPSKKPSLSSPINGDVSKSEQLKSSSKPVKSNAEESSGGKVKIPVDKPHKKLSNNSPSERRTSNEQKKSHSSQSENKVPNASFTSKHKSSESPTEKLSSKKKRKLGPLSEKQMVKSGPLVAKSPSEVKPGTAEVKPVVTSPSIQRIVHNNKNLVNDVSNQFNAMVYLCRYLRVEDLLRVARVNRMFNAVAHSHQLWQVVKLKNSKVRDWNGLADCLTRHNTHTLDMLKMIGSADPDENDEIWNRFYKVIGKIHSLKRLELGRVTAAEILNAASNCSKNLTEFSVIAQKLATIDLKLFQGLPNLEILQLRSFESKREHGLIMMNIPLLAQMRNLRHLSLTGVKNLKSYQVNVLKDFPPLDSLELGDCTKLDERFPECSLAHMTSLVRLRLEMVQGNMANRFVETIATLPRLRTLELINIDTKKGFDEVFGRLSRVEHLLIFPTYITQSSTTNWLVLSGLARLQASLKFLTWGLTQELLRVTTLFIEQWNAQLSLEEGVAKLDPEELKKTIVESNSIPVMKPLPEKFESVHSASGKADGHTGKQNISELDILPIDELKAMLEKVLCETKIKLITVPVSSTTRIYLPNN